MPERAPETDFASVWRAAKEDLRGSMPESTFAMWLAPLRAVSARDQTLYLAAPDRVRTWVERRYAELVRSAVAEHSQEGLCAVAFVEPDAGTEEGARSASSAPASLPVDPRHSFASFVIGEGNRLAHAAALAVAEAPGEAYNPLFIHGAPGLGKTHLLGSIANYLEEARPDCTVHYTTAERFTNEFVTAVRKDGPAEFKRRYRELDALLIDDVQVLEGKPKTEEEFVHTFNALHAAGKQIVLASDRPPSALEKLEERLRDRFAWGLEVELSELDLRSRMTVLWRLTSSAVRELPEPELIRELARRVPSNVRGLEGALTRAIAHSSILGRPLSAESVGEVFGAGAPVPGAADADPVGMIQDRVASKLGVDRETILSPSRAPRVVEARQLAMVLARELTSLSLPAIGRAFGRDHSTVLHAIRKVRGRLETDPQLAADFHNLARDLRGMGLGPVGDAGDPQDSSTSPNADSGAVSEDPATQSTGSTTSSSSSRISSSQ